MESCLICGDNISSGVVLSNGEMLHESCLESLKEKLEEGEYELKYLTDRSYSLWDEIRRREGMGYKLYSFITKPGVSDSVLKAQLQEVREHIPNVSGANDEIRNKLSLIYDYLTSYPPDWDIRKGKVKKRDGNRCSKCANESRLHLHHIVSLSKGGSNELSNLKLLCEGCHSDEHGGRDFSGDFEHSDSESAFSKRVALLRSAIDKKARVEFGYRKPNEKGFKKRTIDPHELVNVDHKRNDGHTLCVRGYCHLRQDKRTFALKRMRGLIIAKT